MKQWLPKPGRTDITASVDGGTRLRLPKFGILPRPAVSVSSKLKAPDSHGFGKHVGEEPVVTASPS